MRFFTDWDEVFSRITFSDEGKKDLTVPYGVVGMQSGSLTLSGDPRRFRLSDTALSQMCTKVGVPLDFLSLVRKRNSPLADDILTDALRAQDPTKRVLLRTWENKARAFLSDDYAIVNNAMVVDRLRSMLRGIPHSVRSLSLTDDMMWLKVTLDDLTVDDPARQGRDLKAGIIIGNSETGLRSLVMMPFIYRAYCTNDLIVQRKVVQKHVSMSPEAVRRMLNASLSDVLTDGMMVVHKFTSLKGLFMRYPRGAIYNVGKSKRFSDRTIASIIQAFDTEPDRSRWGVVNAFTRAAQAFTVDSRMQLETIAGELLAASDKDWKRVDVNVQISNI